MNDTTRLLVVSAHAADFVWRAADAIATVTAGGGVAKVVAINENNFMRRKVGSDQTVKPGHGRGGAMLTSNILNKAITLQVRSKRNKIYPSV
jgi:hypothetical protein